MQRDTAVSGLGTAGIAALVCTLCLWASAFVGIRAALPEYSPGHLALLRYLVASLAMLGLVLLRGGVRLPDARDLPRIVRDGFLGYFGYHVALNYGEQTVSAASACFLIGAIPVFMAVLAFFLLGERPARNVWAGIGVSMAGILLIALGEGQGVRLDVGAGFVLLAALSESFYYVLVKRRLGRYTPLEYTAYTIWAGTACMLVFLPGLGQAVAEAPAGATWAVVYLGVGPGALAYAGWNYAISRGEVSRIATTQYAMPALTLLIGWFWLRELPGPLALGGGVVALAGVWLVSRRGRV